MITRIMRRTRPFFRPAALLLGLLLILLSACSPVAKYLPIGVTSEEWYCLKQVTVVGDYAYASAGYEGLLIIDISDPTNPVKIGQYKPGNPNDPVDISDIEVFGDYAFVLNIEDGLEVIDISNPREPFLANEYLVPGRRVKHLVAQDHLLFFWEDKGWNSSGYRAGDIRILDISDPLNLEEIGVKYTAGRPFAIQGDYLYTYRNTAINKSGTTELEILDISDPTHLVSIYKDDSLGIIESIDFGDDLIYMVTGNSFVVFDVSDPGHPVEIGRFDDLPFGESAVVEGDYAYAVTLYQIKVLNISDPSKPYLVAASDEMSQTVDVVVANDYVYVVDKCLSLYVFETLD